MSFHFAHPGTFMSPKMTLDLQEMVQKNPLQGKALAKLVKNTPLDYQHQALEVVDVGFNGAGVGHKECISDCEKAISSAIAYWATRDTRYASLAIHIINSWSMKNKTFQGDNATLLASWGVCSMARAAELVRYAAHTEVQREWLKTQPVFLSWLEKVIMPVLKSTHIWRWGFINNWHFSNLCARMQIAIFREDKEEWNWCIAMYPKALNQALPFKRCLGETTETCRDVTHNQFLIGGMTQAAEIAFHQGVRSLYDDRLIQVMELQAKIMNKEIPKGLTKEDIRTPYGYWYEPVWHIGYYHFTSRMKKEMPSTAQYIKTISPDRVCFHWGPNYLTHFC